MSALVALSSMDLSYHTYDMCWPIYFVVLFWLINVDSDVTVVIGHFCDFGVKSLILRIFCLTFIFELHFSFVVLC